MSIFFWQITCSLRSKIAKMQNLHCVLKIRLRKLGWGLIWCENPVLQLPSWVALQLNQKPRCGSCAALQKIQKVEMRILCYAFNG